MIESPHHEETDDNDIDIEDLYAAAVIIASAFVLTCLGLGVLAFLLIQATT